MLTKKILLIICSLLMCLSVVACQASKTSEEKQESAVVDSTVIDEQITEEDDLILDLIELNQEKIKEENRYLAKDKKQDVVTDKGELKVPFDEAYPEIFESEEVEYSEDTMMIKFDHSFDGTLNAELKGADIVKLEKLFDLENASWYTAYLNKESDIHQSMELVRLMDNVLVAEYNFKYETAETSEWEAVLQDNPRYQEQSVLNQIDIKEGWNTVNSKLGTPGGSASVVVAVIDTGVDYTHKDLAANIWKNVNEVADNGVDDDGNGYVDDYYGVDITSKNNSAMDDHGHGTHVAGIIGAVNNKEGIVGIAYNSKIMPIKAGDASGYFLQSNIAEAILYAYDHGADVINMSFGGTASSIAVQDALAVAYSRCILVASAGNDGSCNEGWGAVPNYPAALSYVLGVMSVDASNTESNFTNYDSTLFNKVEYEVYAPGEQILSTVPDNKYASLSGTSMAAPVVAAQAALLRGVYSDRDTYSTKFIYGQIVGTAQKTVKCLDPEVHGLHNVPGVVSFNDSLTQLPVPDIGVSDYTLFDTEGFRQDEAGKNNGDGIIDAGETIALGFTLKNRWGMSENTVVSIDVKSDMGIEHPYVTILNNDINYGSIGTYSESDSGKIYNEKMWVGWENPFYVRVSEDCPNNYSITINVTVKYENALNEEDTTVYQYNDKILLKVRRGVIVPNVIKEDLTLTKDNYYIIPNATTILKGATLTIEPGTKIQFWTDDPQDSYADTAIAYLHVEGNLIAEGTEEEPIEMFPSDWMSDYVVEISDMNNEAYSLLKYVNITNPYITVSESLNCVFTQNTPGNVFRRELSNGSVGDAWTHVTIHSDLLKGSVIYKMGGQYYFLLLSASKVEECIFVDSFMKLNYQTTVMYNNVFYGNNTLDRSDSEYSSATGIVVEESENTIIIENFFEYDDASYIVLNNYYYADAITRFLPLIDADWISFNSKEEAEAVFEELKNGTYTLMISKDEEGKFRNHDGSLVYGVSIDKNIQRPDLYIYDYADNPNGKGIRFIESDYEYEFQNKNCILLESKVQFIKRIELQHYLIDLSENEQFQIAAKLKPAYLNYDHLIFESEDSEIASVDDQGVVTAVAPGSTRIYISSSDYAVSTYMTVNVKESVELESLSFTDDQILLGEEKQGYLDVVYAPLNTTEREITFSSSDDSIVSVDQQGKITAHQPGEAIVTVTGENGIFAEAGVSVFPYDLSMKFEENVYTVGMKDEENHEHYPLFNYPSEVLNQNIKWTSSDTSILDVDEEGNLIKNQPGTVVLRAEIEELDLCQDLEVVVLEGSSDIFVKSIVNYNSYLFALTESGEIWRWGNSTKFPTKLNIADAEQVLMCYDYSYVLHKDGSVVTYNSMTGETKKGPTILTDVIAVNETSMMYDSTFFALRADGSIWVWGDHDEGQSGVADKIQSTYDDPVRLDLNLEVNKIITTQEYSYILTHDGYLYTAGPLTNPNGFTLIDTGVNKIYPVNGTYLYVQKDEETYTLYDYRDKINEKEFKKDTEYDFELFEYYSEGGLEYHIYISEGKVYVQGRNYEGMFGVGDNTWQVDEVTEMLVVDQVSQIYQNSWSLFIQTEDGKFYGVGSGQSNKFGNGSNASVYTPTRIVFGKSINTVSVLESSGNTTNEVFKENVVLQEPSVEVIFNDVLEEYIAFDSIEMKTTHPYNGYTAISSKEQLKELYSNPDGKYYLTKNIVFTEADFQEEGEFYNGGYGWIPVGSEDYPFTGIFDGNGYSIKGLVVNSNQNGGFIGYNTGLIRNLTLSEGTISGEGYVGGIAAINNLGLITNCTNENKVISSRHAGGIVGFGQAENCTNNGEVISSRYAGGITAEGVAINSLNTGNINSARYAGGIAAVASGKIENCINRGTVTLNSAEYSGDGQLHPSAGGIAGMIDNVEKEMALVNCLNSGEVTSTGTGDLVSVGGLAGVITAEMRNCVNTGKVTAASGSIGGLAGVVASLAYNGHMPASVQIADSYNTGSLEGTAANAGGLIGQAEPSVIVRETVQLGSVSIEAGNKGWIAGLVNEASTLNNCYSNVTELNMFGLENAENTVNECEELTSLKDESLFVSFDFENIWEMKEEGPVLRSTLTNTGATKFASVEPMEFVSEKIEIKTKLDLSSILVEPQFGFEKDTYYKLVIPMASVINGQNVYNKKIELIFVYRVEDEEKYQYEKKNELVIDEEIMNNRDVMTEEKVYSTWDEFVNAGLNGRFYSNVILNRLNNDNVETWLRIQAPQKSEYTEISLGGNYWGTVNEELINKQILDYDDYQHLADINIGEYLTKAPENTYPFVVDAYLEVGGEKVDTVGNDLVTFVVDFNRDMDTSINLEVKFGSYYPYADYVVPGSYVSARQWRGEMKLSTIIENGYQYWSVSNGRAEGTSYKLYTDWGRFPFMIDTSSAQALLMQAEALETGISLSWTQDDFDTLAGYNLYRSDKEDGLYTKINRTVIPADTKIWLDDTVEPGQKYYYNFTVVQSDMAESEPSGKVVITALDTMAPDIYHSPVYHAFTGNNLVITATVTDNVGINAATLYYRTTGTEEYASLAMTNNNDKYSAIISSDVITTAGLEYYIEATDGISFTYRGTQEEPYQVVVQAAVSDSSKGDVNGDGKITLQDAMMLLYAINDKYNMNEEEFARADINGNMELEAKEALIIIQYVNGTITSIPTGA